MNITPLGACPPRCKPFWVAEASYTARCLNADQLRWGWMDAGARTISGLALIRKEGTVQEFLAVHDTSTPGSPRASIITIAAGVITGNQPLTWAGLFPEPNNIESLAAWRDGKFAATTGEGDLYILRISGTQIVGIGMSTLTGPPAGQVESFAIVMCEWADYCIYATRGAPSVPADISLALLFQDGLVGSLLDTGTFEAPFPNDRQITALYVGPTGILYATAASDPGDDGPFSSAIYNIGQVGVFPDFTATLTQGAPVELYRTLSHKAEAIAGVPNDGLNLGFVLGADDENRGGFIYFERPPIGRSLTIKRQATSTVGMEDAKRKARILAKKEAKAELQCYFQDTQSAAPFCAGDYYEPLTRTAWSPNSQEEANARAIIAAQEAAQEWCDTEFDPEPPPVIVDGE